MINKDNHPIIDDYLDSVIRLVKARELHKDIRREIADHLEELVSLKREEGSSEEEAARWAVRQMGEPSVVGSELNKVHKPRIPWGLIGWVAVWLIFSFVAMYAVELSYAGMERRSYIPFLLKKVEFTAIGLIPMVLLLFFDYRRILKYSWGIYIGTAVISLITVLSGRQINGMKAYISLGPIQLDWISISIYLFIIAAAGILSSMDSSQRSGWKQYLLLLVVPTYLYLMSPSVSSIILYVCSYLILLYFVTKSWRVVLTPILLFGAFVVVILWISEYRLDRLTAFLNPYSDPEGAGYMYMQISQAIRSAGWWGHGLGAVNIRLPEIHTDNLFTYLIYSLGWLPGMVIIVCAVLFAVQMLQAFANVRDRYGKILIGGLGSLLVMQFVWNLGMSTGVLPILGGISLPFLSYGGSHSLIEMVAMGIMFSVYRRKDMIRTRA
ncbi:FtsW/RodA/SpoVE family cell cycle protein [Paenibacillus sp. OAS669]|uniref:FtsW/RodA/SpoVE family cell cycle protein n=1 Tax=Paenibacillus sp. OAS669 TaxID=2663821 RepID=UPI0017895CAA|nr:FtsW/RodA/SpoVE family cell cycle protein [Paenibacillus sp. OAS669]MBE1447067.1 cell division protein FtsW (lipid II flippase) [Paenibacillus sp. OAS669]